MLLFESMVVSSNFCESSNNPRPIVLGSRTAPCENETLQQKKMKS